MKFLDILGTIRNTFRIGLSGPILKNVSGNLAVRTTGDSSDAQITASQVNVSGNSIVLNSDGSNTGTDYSVVIARPTTGMTGAYTLTVPVDDGSPGQVLSTDGSGATSWTTVGSTPDKLTLDTTSFTAASSSTIALFTLPANATIVAMRVIVDVTFNANNSNISIGVTGNLSKYFASNQSDLSTFAKYEVYPNNLPGASENLIATFAVGASTAGSGRIEVEYAIAA